MKIINWIKGLFKSKQKPAWITGKSKSDLNIYSFHPQTGVFRQETGTIYVESYSARRAQREVEKLVRKKTGKTIKFEKEPTK